MHTMTYLKAALHQLSLAKTEMNDLGHHDLSRRIEAAERSVATLIRESYTIGVALPAGRLRVS